MVAKQSGYRVAVAARSAEQAEQVDSGALDGLSVRYIHAVNDDWRSFAGRLPGLLEQDRLALRVR